MAVETSPAICRAQHANLDADHTTAAAIEKPLTGDWSGVQRFSIKLPHHEDPVERTVLGIVELFKRMKGLESLYPDPINGAIFNQLFDLVMTDARLTAVIPELRRIWGDGEYLLELEFARKVISGDSRAESQQLFESFPYLEQYYQLARMEANTLDTAVGETQLSRPRKIAFLGSGPMPFTALCMRPKLGDDVEIINIDRSEEAIQHGTLVACRLGDNMRFVKADVASVPDDLRDCDVVHFAALVGDEEQKLDLLISVAKAMKKGALIMLRSTDSLRQCLYPKIDTDNWDVLSVLTPVVATRYFGKSTSLTSIVLSVD
ncbi:nicotianamine synthase [Colletotrichum higginsianum]|uniref:Nicotianamine synthase n=1 Tax=Colletotrichum higginsianum (strain IMI 349063) TaxID=759273 RepID=H1VFY6_COLHI|nr:Nicotianamine synthase [Colletotrichum higginsianum IMI 349063]OBR03012.1 Nicotianamine synthase [Colletotrichum higginsianum IMI 349063]GJD05021.1 nicotianamine synthase [Colletotrichum higginsianum]CCF39139.1 nicotianamine synthase [Colletotrichum higginsianum]